MKKQILFTLAIISISFAVAQDHKLPYVYTVENTGADCPTPPLLPVEQLPSIPALPDPFAWSNGNGRCQTFADWTCRRAEIKAEIEHYEIGRKPDRPENITATYSDGVLTVVITENNKTVTLRSNVTVPSGTGPFPVILGMNRPTGSLPASLFNDFIQIPFMHNQVATYGAKDKKDTNAPFYQMYPELSEAGDYCAWSWGISRLIDGLEIVQSQLNADLSRIGITGCSYAGKMALFGSAFDERIALAIVQESGGGGVNSWRVSETIGNVEKISNTSYFWFMKRLKDQFDGQVSKLPYDHHELIAMIAPRAVLILGNPDYVWLGDPSGYVSSMAAMEVWKAMGIEDRIGFDFSKDHKHCVVTESQHTAVNKFVDKFLRGKNDVNTVILDSPFSDVNVQEWISSWAGHTLP